jgi:hypothetical protein
MQYKSRAETVEVKPIVALDMALKETCGHWDVHILEGCNKGELRQP